MPGTAGAAKVEVGPHTVRRGDVVTIGGGSFTVTDLITLAGGTKRIRFLSGETLTMREDTRLTVSRRLARW